MNIPANLLYTKDHEWLRIEDDIAFIGITNFAQSELGDIVYVEIETVDETLKQNDVFGSVEAVKTVSDLFLPVNGEVLESNPKLEDNPELVNDDPYGEGWMIKLKMDANTDLKDLLKADAYALLIGS
ncbi:MULTISPECIES: glycine cleavage system protein GcvH [Bizionia]|uniref:Glycine cleavage system H protein n=1 Tax=Bizionia algoritergicola TaxID=291187 RepID=A0A5D0QSY4_9FLAO|nr:MULTISPECIES: glycine cleavage system protein GcvH [Bizionia]OBX22120.1 glycine cleavage system protein H [Bizionia sp. APA-3]TYB72333.1 glycine cleavage system protein GcvH [Bizionia algoritergicola]